MSATKAQALKRLQALPGLRTPPWVPVRRGPLDLSLDQPQTALTAEAKSAAVAALRQGETHYADVPGIGPLRETVATWLSETQSGRDFTSNQVLITAGVQEARFLTIQVLTERLGRLALPDVAHPGVRQAADLRAIDQTLLPTDAALGYLPSLDTLERALQIGVRLLYLESPSRLSGAVYTPDQVRALTALIRAHDVAVIWDQGLAPWVAPGSYASLVQLAEVTDRVAILGELWPGAGLDNWHIGYVGAPAEWIESLRVQKQVISICTNTAVQYAALAAAEQFEPLKSELLTGLAAQRELVMSDVIARGLTPVPGAAVTLLALKSHGPAALDMLLAAGFTVGDGALFGAPGIVRLAITADGASRQAIPHLVREH